MKIENKSNTAKVYLYGQIGTAELNAAEFVKAVDKIEQKQIEIHINSPGGSVFEGFTIYNKIKDLDKNVDVYIDGLAASIASVIALAGDKVYIESNGMFMIHNVSGMTMGDTKEHEKTIELLQKLQDQIVNIYAGKSDMDADDVQEMMDEETWMTAEEAKSWGFVDEIIEAKNKIAACVDPEKFNYSNIPEFLKKKRENKPTELKKQGDKMNEDVLKKITGVLDTSAENIVSKIEEIQAENLRLNEENSDLVSDKNELNDKLEKLQKKEKERKVENAIESGKMVPAQHDWALNLDDAQLDEFLENAPKVDLNKETIKGKDTDTEITFKDLLNDFDLYKDYHDNKPKVFTKLRDKHLEGRE